jgi:hypothetical protein
LPSFSHGLASGSSAPNNAATTSTWRARETLPSSNGACARWKAAADRGKAFAIKGPKSTRQQSLRRTSADHCQPEYAPAQDAEYEDQIRKSIGGAQLRVLGLTSGFENLVERFDLPVHGVPVELLDRFCTRLDREMGQPLPLDARTPGRHIALLRLDLLLEPGSLVCRLLFSHLACTMTITRARSPGFVDEMGVIASRVGRLR